MKSTSVVVRSILFHVAALAAVVLLLPLTPLLVFDRRVWSPIVVAYLRVLGWLLKVICGVDHRIDGLEHLPKAPYLLASRHESAWEVLFYPLFFDDPVAFAKREIFSYPLGGRIARRGGHISIDRSGDLAGIRAAFQSARDTVAAGRSVLIFPSGTRHVEGRDRIQSGVGALYDLLGVPCVPVVLDSGRCWPPDSWLKYPGTIHVRIGEPIAPGIDRVAFTALLKERLGLTEPASPAAVAAEPIHAPR
ncbi:lysophospholipid acyltransferase family protein [Pinisolibacter sp.]|uniref:lysophospholipid acyltransferase family protein n=1 Tax=Pinisolibacter sp. TaxID=2172024 RepID=UPI002FDE1C1C